MTNLQKYVLDRSEPAANGCRLWTKQQGSLHPSINYEKRIWRIQRFAYMAFKGAEALTPGLQVFAACGNSRCVDIDHLKLRLKAQRAAVENAAAAAVDDPGLPEDPSLRLQALALRNPDLVDAPITLPPEFERLVTLATRNVGMPASRRVYARALEGFFRWCIINRHEKVDRQVVLDYRAWKLEQCQPTTVNLHIAAIRQLARELRWEKLLDPETCEAICAIKAAPEQRREDGSLRRGVRFTADQLVSILKLDTGRTVRQRLKARAILTLMVFTGLRREEVANLEWAHMGSVPTSTGTRMALLNVRTKGGKLRDLPLPEIVVDALKEWRQEQVCEGCNRRRVLCTCIAPSGTSMFGLTPAGIGTLIERASVDLGIRFTPHDLRRSFAALAARTGSGLLEIQQALGHSDPKTTLRYIGQLDFADVTPGDKIAAEAASRMEQKGQDA